MSQPIENSATSFQTLGLISTSVFLPIQDTDTKRKTSFFNISSSDTLTDFSLENQGSELAVNSPIATASQGLLRFSDFPKEIRNMICRAMVDFPRLLPYALNSRFSQPRHLPDEAKPYYFHPAAYHDLPNWFLLSKEIYIEMQHHVTTVPRKLLGYNWAHPWAYINPRYDVIYSESVYDIPSFRDAPGIQTVAFFVGFWNRVVPFEAFLVDFSALFRLSSLQEVLLVRDISGEIQDEWQKQSQLFPKSLVQKHSCGFFGTINEDLEKMISGIPGYRASQDICDLYVDSAIQAIEQFCPGQFLPKVSAVYNKWTDTQGIWQDTAEVVAESVWAWDSSKVIFDIPLKQ